MQFNGKTIKCITFDLDDTLWHCLPVVHNAEFALFIWLGELFPELVAQHTIQSLMQQRREYLQQFPEQAHDFSWQRRKWLEDILSKFGGTKDDVETGFQVYLKARSDIVLFDGAHEVLEKVNNRYRSGSITNGNADVHMAGIGAFFDFSITAAEAGAAKPSPIIFEAAVTAAGVEPENILHIGDDAERDMLGAAKVGMQTLWVNPQGLKWKGKYSPGAQIRMISELNAFLES